MKNLNSRWNRFLLRNRDKGIPNLMLFIVLGSALVYIMSYALQSTVLYNYLAFNKAAILRGEVWRLLTHVFTYQSGNGIFFQIIFYYFFYMLGRRIEYSMGTLKFNLYYFSGILIMDIFAMIFCPNADVVFTIYGNMGWYLHLSMLLMFATTNPDAQFLVLYFIPVKAWFMGIVYLVMIGLEVLSYQSIFPHNLFPLVGLVNFLLFAGQDLRNLFPFIPQRKPRKAAARQSKQTGSIPFRPQTPDFNHRCTVCGRTDATDPQLEFRYCSRCNGYFCYCEDHINNHEHVE